MERKYGSLNELDDLPEHVFCEECGEEIIVVNIRDIPKTCGKRECDINHEYRKKHFDPVTGEEPTAEEVKEL